MTAKTMAEVIMNHPWLPDHEGLYTGLCPSCPGVKIHGGHNSPSHAAHIAAALSAAGFGLVADAKAEAHKLKSVRGELKSLGRNLDSWESEGHTTATIRFLRQWISRATKAAS